MVAWKTESDTTPLHTVLIVCDEPNTIATWDSLLSQRNCIVLSESSVRTGLQTARLVAPSLMLVDLQISKSERTELLNGLRQASAGPILLLVSASTAQLALEANSSSADEYLMKPVNPAVLVVKAMAWLGQGRRAGRAQQPLMR
ncbi:MAG: response regulator [Anaerolineales bacterium]|nr:response regulator [Anaerolineales bacterium]